MRDDRQTNPLASNQLQKRRFLGRIGGAVLASGAILLTLPLLRFLTFHIPRRPRQITVARALVPGGFFLAEDFILFAGKGDRGPWAVSRICTHLGCRVMYRQNLDLLVCPCHQSRFSLEGRRLAGPAKRDLKRFPVRSLAGAAGAPAGYVVTI